jgi:streptomycin 6-kinase
MFEPYLKPWNLRADGPAIVTRGSRLLPVRLDGQPAMLKITTADEEKRGGALMAWWDGDGAAQVYAHDDIALLMERAEGGASLRQMAMTGRDDEASRIICAAVARLHAARPGAVPPVVVLADWFRSLERAAANEGGLLRDCAAVARTLLTSPRDVFVVHGDIHHDNILDFGHRGWLAVDPKGLYGERGFDYANTLCNPDLPTARQAGRLLRQVEVVARAARLEPRRLMQWVMAYAGLSASWFIEDGQRADAAAVLDVARVAASSLMPG